MQESRVGLLAGGGELPLEFLKSAREKGIRTTTFAVSGITEKRVEELSDEVVWIKPLKLGKFLKELKKRKLKRIAVLGKIEHSEALKLRNLDLTAVKLLMSLRDFKPESLIKGVFSEIEKAGVEVISPEEFLKHLLIPPGAVLGPRPDEETLKDMQFGMEVARKIAAMDIGQTVVVKKGTVVAVEGVEGTDRCIERGAELSSGGFVVCKAARPHQDMRIDVPTVGEKTVELVKQLGGKGIAVEGGKTFVVTPERIGELCLRQRLPFITL